MSEVFRGVKVLDWILAGVLTGLGALLMYFDVVTTDAEVAGSIADGSMVDGAVRLPPVRYQPVAAEDVAGLVARVAAGDPLNGTVAVAGPEQYSFDGFIRMALAARRDPREVVGEPHARYFGTELAERSLVPGEEAELGETGFEAWSTTQ